MLKVESPMTREWWVPTLADIGNPDGPVVASLFAGCGGSSIGWRWAGYRVAWASEFLDHAADVYEANLPGTVVDRRDVREVEAGEILEAVRIDRGELDVLDGSPPCQSFSMAGKRQRGWGRIEDHADGTSQRSDDLFFEFVRLLHGLQPRAFVAENVAGLTVGVAKGYFKRILAALREAGYVVEARVVDAALLDVPQRRRRLVFVGVRENLARRGFVPRHPSPRYPSPTLADAIPRTPLEEVEPEAWISDRLAEKWRGLVPGEQHDRNFNLIRATWREPCPTICAAWGSNSGIAGVLHPDEPRRFSIRELARVFGFPDDFEIEGTYSERWARLGNSVPPPMMRRIAETLAKEILV